MGMDTYSLSDKQARCSKCARFMPWSRSIQVEKSDGMPLPSPVLVEIGICLSCAFTERPRHTKDDYAALKELENADDRA